MQNYVSQKKLFNYKTVFTLTVFVLVSLAAVNLIGTNILSTQGFAVSEDETRTIALEKENQQLSVKIEEATTLGSLQKLADERGFIRTKSIVFVPGTSSFASR